MTAEKITPADIEAKMREFQGEAEESVDTVKNVAVAVAVGVAVVVFVVAFGMGRTRGKKKSTVVEIRRI